MDTLPVRFNPPPGFPPFIVQGVQEDPVSQFVAMLLLPFLLLRVLMAGGTREVPLPFGGGPPLAAYSNEESWEIVRGADGHITGVVIHREASER